jgi:Ala-tRNA(Pro) deacylase
MTIARTVAGALERNRAAFTVVHHARAMSVLDTARAARVLPEAVAKAVVLCDDGGYVMAVLPGNRHVRIRALSERLGRHLELAREARIAPVFEDCEVGAIPPMGCAYGMETVVDESLVGQNQVYFVAGGHEELVCVKGAEFLRLLGEAKFGRFSQ